MKKQKSENITIPENNENNPGIDTIVNLKTDHSDHGHFSWTESGAPPEMISFSLLQNIINIFPDYVLVIDEDHRILLANDNMLKVIGKTQKDIKWQFCSELIHGSEEPFSDCPLREVLEKDRPVVKEFFDSFFGKWISSAIYPTKFQLQEGKRVLFHVVSDISKRKNTEEIILRQKDYLENIIDSLTQPFYVIDANDYTITMANSAANFGPLDEKSKCFILSHKNSKPCSSSRHPCPIEEIKKKKKPVIVEHKHLNNDGQLRTVEVHGYPIFDKEGQISHIIEYTLDITERRHNEKVLKQVQKNLSEKSKGLEEHVTALKVLLNIQEDEKRTIEKNFIDNIKILIIPYLEKLSNQNLNDNQRQYLNIIENSLHELTKPYNKILMDDDVKLSPVEFRIAKLVKEDKTSSEIAEIMHISEYTVKEHRYHIRHKLGLTHKKVNLKIYLQKLFK